MQENRDFAVTTEQRMLVCCSVVERIYHADMPGFSIGSAWDSEVIDVILAQGTRDIADDSLRQSALNGRLRSGAVLMALGKMAGHASGAAVNPMGHRDRRKFQRSDRVSARRLGVGDYGS
jgi:hypothetical protein